MKKIIYLFLAVAILGCSYEGQKLRSYIDDPRTIIKDPHFADYKQKRQDLESQYLSKEVSYADYVMKMEELENQYDKEVQERDAIISAK